MTFKPAWNAVLQAPGSPRHLTQSSRHHQSKTLTRSGELTLPRRNRWEKPQLSPETPATLFCPAPLSQLRQFCCLQRYYSKKRNWKSKGRGKCQLSMFQLWWDILVTLLFYGHSPPLSHTPNLYSSKEAQYTTWFSMLYLDGIVFFVYHCFRIQVNACSRVSRTHQQVISPWVQRKQSEEGAESCGQSGQDEGRSSNCRHKAINQWGPDLEDDTETLGQNPAKELK